MKKILIILMTAVLLFGFVACHQEEPVVDVASISLEKELIAINDSNGGYAVKATVFPVDATNKDLVYESDSESILVDQTGAISLVTEWSENSHYYGKITVSSKMNPSVVRYCYVTVNYDVIKKGGIAVKMSSEATETFDTVDIYGGKSITPVLSIESNYDMPEATELDELFTITSSDSTVVSVDKKTGEITAADKAGTATVTIESNVPYYDEDTKTYVKASKEYEVCVNPVRTVEQLSAFLSGTAEVENPTGVNTQKTAYLALSSDEDVLTDMLPVTVKGEKILDIKDNDIQFKKTNASVDFINVASNSDLTIKGTGEISGSSDDDFTLINNGGSLKIEGVTLETKSEKNKESSIISLGSESKNFEIKDVDLVAEGKAQDATENSKVYAIKSAKTDESVKIGEDVSISITGGGDVYGIKAGSGVEAKKGLSITVENAKNTKGIEAGVTENDVVTLTNGSIKITSEVEGSTASAVSGGKVEVTDGEYDVTTKAYAELINSIVSAVLKKLNTNITVNITGGNVTIINGNTGTVTSEGGIYTATATDTSGVAKGIDTTGDVTLKSVDLSVEGATATGVKGNELTIENGTYEVEATGTTVSTATATGFIFEGPTCLSSPTVTIEAKGVARVADVGPNPESGTNLQVKKGSYDATSTESDAVAFGSSSDEKGMSVPATFSGSVNVEATAEKGKASAVDSHSDVTVGKDELNGGSFEATGKNACVFDVDNNGAEKKNTVELNNVNATAKEFSKGTGSKSNVVYSNNNKTDISGGTYISESDDQSTTFELKNCSDSSVNVEKASASGDIAICLTAETSDLDALGGEFISESDGTATGDKASGIELKDTNCTILKNTIVKVEAEKPAYGVCVVDEKKPIIIDIQKGLDVDVKSDDNSAFGIKLDNESDGKVNDLKVNIYDGDIAVCVSGDEEAIALWNTGELNFVNNTDDEVFKGSFEAETDGGIAMGLLNGDFDETNWEAAKNGNKAKLEEEGMININGESDIKFSAKASDGDSNTPTSNYAGDMTVYTNDQPVGKGNEFSEEYDTGNGAVLSLTNVDKSVSSYVTFTVDNVVNNTNNKRKTYQVPEGTTWYQFVNNELLGHNDMLEVKEGTYAGKVVNNADLSSGDSKKYYISLNGKAVNSLDDIESDAEYYYGSPIILETEHDSETIFVEKDSTWSNFASESYSDYSSDTVCVKGKTTIVFGDTAGANQSHIMTKNGEAYQFVEAGTSITYGGTYYVCFDLVIKESINENEKKYTVKKGSTWTDFCSTSYYTVREDSNLVYYKSFYNMGYKIDDEYRLVNKNDLLDSNTTYEVLIRFYLNTFDGTEEKRTECFATRKTTWNLYIQTHPNLVKDRDADDAYIMYGSGGPKLCSEYANFVSSTWEIECDKDYWFAYTVVYYSSVSGSRSMREKEFIAGRTIEEDDLSDYQKVTDAKFGGWYTSPKYEESSKFIIGKDRVTSDLVLYAKQYFDLEIIYILNSAMSKDHVNNVYSRYKVQHIYGVDTPLLTINDYGYMASIAPGYDEDEVFVGWTLKDLTDEIQDGSAYTSVLTNVIPKSSTIKDFINYKPLDPFVYVYALWIEWNGDFFEYGTEPDINT